MAAEDSLLICSRALALINADNVVSFDDGTNEAQLSSIFYEPTLLSTLSEHRWNFAVKQAQMAKVAEAPDDRFSVQYDFPSQLLNIHDIYPDNIKYEIFGRRVLTNYDGELWVEGMFRVDESIMPFYFTEYLEYRLAAKFAFPITGDKALAQAMESASNIYQKKAKLADSKQRKGVGFKSNQFSLVTVRG